MRQFLCTSCHQKETKCQCGRFCILCRSGDNVRLCEDGCYYCRDCREVCEFSVDELQYDS